MPKGSRKYVSDNRLPLPVVLTIGDERYFSRQAWEGVVAQAADAHEVEPAPRGPHAVPTKDKARDRTSKRKARPSVSKRGTRRRAPKDGASRESSPAKESITWEHLEPLLEEQHDRSAELLRHRGWGRCRRSTTRLPVPLQLTHENVVDPKRLHEQVRRILDLFDVWGAVASASAGQVKPLRDVLHGVDVPLLVTTDSTTVPGSPQPANELRLMPSNRAQARAMLFAAAMGEADERAKRPGVEATVLMGPPSIAYSWDRDPEAYEYVNDLRRELEQEARSLGVPLEDYDDEQQDHPGPVIVIGYQSHAKELIDRRSTEHATILSDGCATDTMREAVTERLKGNARFWFIASPDLPPHALGRKAYSAIAGAGRRTLTWDAASDGERDLPSRSRRDVIKDMLNRTDPNHFKFAGMENVALAYRVQPILPARGRSGETPPVEGEGAPQANVIPLTSRTAG
jgi:hypothetical protein